MFHDGQRRALVTCSVAACLAVLAGTGDLDAQVTFDVVADLGSIGGAAPLGGVIRGADGALYGMTSEGGGADNCGLVYRLDAMGMLAPIHEFSWPDGCQPMGELALGPDGSLYGVTRKGGDANPSLADGTVYRIAPDGTFTVLHRFVTVFTGPTPYLVPYGPSAGLTLAPDGNFYGTLRSGDVFRISPSGAFALVHQYEPGSEPQNLVAALVLGRDGYLYGTAPNSDSARPGGGGGMIFVVSPTGGYGMLPCLLPTLLLPTCILHEFIVYGFGLPPGFPRTPEGVHPEGELAIGPGGELYVENPSGGPGSPTDPGAANDRGTIVRLTPDGTLAVLHAFAPAADGTYPDGSTPRAGLILGSDGFVYGTTSAGGATGKGTIFRMALDGAFTTLHSFEAEAGAPTKGRLFEAAPGVFYGTASGGVVYRLSVVGALLSHNLEIDTDEDQPVDGVLKASGGGSAMTFSLATNGTLGVATILDVTTGAFRYTPNPDANGTDTFTFSVMDGARESDPATVTVTIAPVNDAPVARNAAIWAIENVPVHGTLSGSDRDSTALTFEVVTGAAKGTVQFDAATGQFTYMPSAGAVGLDAFTFRVSDGTMTSEVATMYVAIASRPSP